MAPYALLLALSIFLSASLSDAASPKVVSMPMYRQARRSLQKRATDETLSITLGNALLNGLYYVNASVGTPPQLVQLQVDTGSSDVWMFGPNSCQSSTSPCLGGTFDDSQSSSLTLIARGEFNITYQTPNSGVTGDYIGDNFEIGGTTITNLTMAVATQAAYVETGIMGIGFDTDESIFAEGLISKPYPNIIDVMVEQNIISTRAYSLWLDDLEDATGTVLFGGYDSAKYSGDLALLQIYPDAQSGIINSMTVAWSSLSVTDSSGTASVTSGDFPIAAVLDSGTTVTVVPPDLFSELATYFGVVSDQNYGYLVECSIASYTGSLNFGFGGNGGPVISVSFSEFALPIVDQNGNPVTFNDGTAACSFGIGEAGQGDYILLGDTFLRSAYVVYDLDTQQIGIAQTLFNTTSSNIVEIGSSSGNVGGGSSVAAGPSVVQTATANQAPSFIQSESVTASFVQTQPSVSHIGSITGIETVGQPTQSTNNGANTATANPAGTSPTKNAASTITSPFDSMGLLVLGGTLALILLGGLIHRI